jgi:hypothetical protein
MPSTSEDIFEESTSFTTDSNVNSTTTIASGEILNISSATIFTGEECNKIIDSCIEELYMPCRIVGDSNLHKSKRQKLKGDVNAFPFTEITAITKKANEEIYDFKLLGIIDQDYPQVFKYDVGDHYDFHVDLNPLAVTRKLSFIVCLDKLVDRTGGKVEFLNTELEDGLQEQGNIIIFPSFLPWKITKVTKGSARFIFGNIHGALFR